MLNLLPDVKRSIVSRGEDKNASWRPAEADPNTAKISYVLEQELSEVPISKREIYAENKIPQKEPNIRHLANQHCIKTGTETTALSKLERGTADKPDIIFVPPPSLTRKTIISVESAECFILKMINTLPVCMDLFFQKKNSLSSGTLYPDRPLTRLIAGTEDEENRLNPACFWYGNAKRAVLHCTNRQEVRTFKFLSAQQIGMEVEMEDNRLICSQVISGCQAEAYHLELIGATIVAVNGVRVLDMEGFRDAIIAGRVNEHVILQVASFKGGKGKLDHLYLHDFDKKKNVKALLSNIMMHGLDGDHQHDLHDADYSGSSSEKSEEEDEEKADEKKERGISARGWEHLEEYPDVEEAPPGNENDEGSSGRRSGEDEDADNQYYPEEEEEEEDGEEAADGGMRARRKPGRAAEAAEHHPRHHASSSSSSVVVADTGGDDDMGSVHTGASGSPEGSHHSRRSEHTYSTASDSWNALTKVEDVVPVQYLVCAPKGMERSVEWGEPSKILQVSNYSTSWKVELFWVDEYGSMERKGEVASGGTQFELADAGHLWVLVATSTIDPSHWQSHSSSNHLVDSKDEHEESPHDKEPIPALLAMHLTRSSLTSSKCASILWTPLSSMSINQRVYPPMKEESDGRSAQTKSHFISAANEQQYFTTRPNMHVQVFDGINKGVPDNLTTNKERDGTKVDAGGDSNVLDKVKLAHWPRRSHSRRPREDAGANATSNSNKGRGSNRK